MTAQGTAALISTFKNYSYIRYGYISETPSRNLSKLITHPKRGGGGHGVEGD